MYLFLRFLSLPNQEFLHNEPPSLRMNLKHPLYCAVDLPRTLDYKASEEVNKIRAQQSGLQSYEGPSEA
jgi:hypothetical protein